MGLMSSFLFVKGLYNPTTDMPSQRACDRRTARTHVRFTRTHGQGEGMGIPVARLQFRHRWLKESYGGVAKLLMDNHRLSRKVVQEGPRSA